MALLWLRVSLDVFHCPRFRALSILPSSKLLFSHRAGAGCVLPPAVEMEEIMRKNEVLGQSDSVNT